MPAERLKLRGSAVPVVPAVPMRFRLLGLGRSERDRSLYSRMVRLGCRRHQRPLGDENPARHERFPCEERATRVEVSRSTSAREIG
jgi:hypothetical protein